MGNHPHTSPSELPADETLSGPARAAAARHERVARTYLISCGGTGGHLAPGIALAQELIARGHAATLLISEKRVDAQLAAKYPDLHFKSIPGAPLTFAPSGLLRFLIQQAKGARVAVRLVREMRPDVIIGFGGFTSAAVMLVGAATRVPIALHEANRVPGRAIRVMTPLARRVYVPAGVALARAGERLRHAGLPVRREIQREDRAAASISFGFDPARPMVAVLGGSQGATALNAWAETAAPALATAGIQLCCVTGGGKGATQERVFAGPGGAAVAMRYLPFCDRMASLLSAADLVVSRAGAGTLAELIRCTTPSILVPYPHAADNHQAANAEHLRREQAALVVEQSGLSAITAEVIALVLDAGRLGELRRNLHRLDGDDPARQLADDLEELSRVRPPRVGGRAHAIAA